MRLSKGSARAWGRVGVWALALGLGASAVGQTFFTTYTRSEADIDMDGPLVAGTGDLGTTSISGTILLADLPAEFVTAGVTSITVNVTASGGNVSADQGNFVEARGLGVASVVDLNAVVPSNNESSLNQGETLTVSVTSTGLADVMIAGVGLSAFRNTFPESEAVLAGATVGGSTVLNGGGGELSPDVPFPVTFDNAVSSFAVSGTSDNDARQFRLNGLILVVPEPTTAGLMVGLGTLALRRRR
ncbi:MAG: PEP-CTERM sorting domain-containing protein [Planctomycetota bacterium]